MTTPLQNNQLKRNNILKKIKVEGEVDQGQKVIVRYARATLKWNGFESRMAMWTKIYGRI